MTRAILRILHSEDGQDLADYCLLMALVALIAAGILFRVSGGLENLWTIGQQGLSTANSTVQNSGITGTANH